MTTTAKERRLAAGRMGSGSERGSAVTEMTVLVPVFALLIGVAVLFGRTAVIQQQVIGAAGDAARAASVRNTPTAAIEDAQAAALASLGDVPCGELDVVVDAVDLHPGGRVSASVRCTVDFADVIGLVVPGQRTLHAEVQIPIDVHRAGATP